MDSVTPYKTAVQLVLDLRGSHMIKPHIPAKRDTKPEQTQAYASVSNREGMIWRG